MYCFVAGFISFVFIGSQYSSICSGVAASVDFRANDVDVNGGCLLKTVKKLKDFHNRLLGYHQQNNHTLMSLYYYYCYSINVQTLRAQKATQYYIFL